MRNTQWLELVWWGYNDMTRMCGDNVITIETG